MPFRRETPSTASVRRPLAAGAAAVLLFAGASLAGVLAAEGTQPEGESTTSEVTSGSDAGAATPAGASGASPAERLARGRRLVEANDVAVAGASRDGLLEAERELRAAIEGGCPDGALAYRLLARTYAALAQGWAETAEEGARWDARRRDALGAAVVAAPADAKAHLEYALALSNRGERVRQLEASVRLDPADAAARRALAEALLESDRAEEGIRHLLDAAMLSDRAALEEHGQAMMYLLRANGREADEERVRERMQALGI